jgi:hypothetical protein
VNGYYEDQQSLGIGTQDVLIALLAVVGITAEFGVFGLGIGIVVSWFRPGMRTKGVVRGPA